MFNVSLITVQINNLVHGEAVSGHIAEDTDFPMPLVRHYIKELGIPARRFNMNITIAQVDVQLQGQDQPRFKATFVRQDGVLKGTEGNYEGKSLDDSVVEFLAESQDEEITAWMKENGVAVGGKNLHDIFERDVSAPAINLLVGGKRHAEEYLDLIKLNHWNDFLALFGTTYQKWLRFKNWPLNLIDFYGKVYRTNMQGQINQQIIEDEIGHWWQPNMFTLTFGMHSLYDAPEGKGFKGFRQRLQESDRVHFKFGHQVIALEEKKKDHKAQVVAKIVTSGQNHVSDYDTVLVTIPPPQLQGIEITGFGFDVQKLTYPHMRLAKKMFQFDEAFWMHADNNQGGFGVDTYDGFAVIANDCEKGHLSQFRYSNPEREGNVILNYEFGDNASFAAQHDDEDILDTVQKMFQTGKVDVKKQAVMNRSEDKPGVFHQPWLHIFDSAVSEEQVKDKKAFCNHWHPLLHFAGDFWSYCPQWQEGAFYSAIHAVFKIAQTGLFLTGDEFEGSDPFQYYYGTQPFPVNS